MGRMKFDHFKWLVTLTRDNIKQLSLYLHFYRHIQIYISKKGLRLTRDIKGHFMIIFLIYDNKWT